MPLLSTKSLKQIVAGGFALALIVGTAIYYTWWNGHSGLDEEGDSGPKKVVELASHKGELEEGRPVRVTGVIRNTSDRELGRVKIDVRFFNGSGSQVGDTTAQNSGLGAGKEWQFEVPVVGDSVVRYEIDRVTWQ